MLRFWQQYLGPFLNSTFFLAVTTVAVAISAFIVYRKGKEDHKRDAANIILQEIKNAEGLIKQAKKTLKQSQVSNGSADQKFPQKLRVMKIGSWVKYRHLFSRDIEPDLWKELDEFYENCKLFDEALTEIDSFFLRNESEVRVNAFRVIANYMVEASKKIHLDPGNDKVKLAENEAKVKQYQEYIKAFTSAFPTSYAYAPVKPYQDAEYYLSQLPRDITTRDSGKRIKELAGLH